MATAPQRDDRALRVGIDLGGTKIEVIALDRDGRERIRRRTATPSGGYAATLSAITNLVRGVEDELGLRGSVGIATPGALSPATGLMKNANSVCLIGEPLQRDLSERLGRPVQVANDANCFALSEAVDGAGQGARVVFGVILGTGVGGGIVVDERVLCGPNAIAGEWGHNPLPWPEPDEWPDAPACYCGRIGCIEAFLAGPSLERDYAAETGTESETGLAARVPEIVRRAAAGEAAATRWLDRYERRLARALASVINLLDPDVIVLGGGVSNVERLYDNVPKHWGRWVFSDRVATRLLRNVHGDSSGVRGAAWLTP